MILKMMQGILGAGLMGLFGCAAQPPLETVQHVDLQKYAGKWYEIASFPTRFQAGCQATTATYTLSPEGHVVVENRCRRDSLNGELSYIKGKAWVEPNSGNAKLKVQFFWPFRGKYWILDWIPSTGMLPLAIQTENTFGFYAVSLKWRLLNFKKFAAT